MNNIFTQWKTNQWKKCSEMEPKGGKQMSYKGHIPNYFCYAVAEAALKYNKDGYWTPGFHLALHVYDLLSRWDEDEKEVDRLIDQLSKAAEREEIDYILKWLDFNFPAYMALIPPDIRIQYAQGVISAYEEGKIG